MFVKVEEASVDPGQGHQKKAELNSSDARLMKKNGQILKKWNKKTNPYHGDKNC